MGNVRVSESKMKTSYNKRERDKQVKKNGMEKRKEVREKKIKGKVDRRWGRSG